MPVRKKKKIKKIKKTSKKKSSKKKNFKNSSAKDLNNWKKEESKKNFFDSLLGLSVFLIIPALLYFVFFKVGGWLGVILGPVLIYYLISKIRT